MNHIEITRNYFSPDPEGILTPLNVATDQHH